MELVFKEAQKEQVEDVVALIYSSSTDMLDYLYGKKAIEFLKFAFLNEKGFFSYKKQILGFNNNDLVCSATVYDTKEFFKLNFENILITIKFFSLKEIVPIIKKGMEISNLYIKPSSNTIYFGNLAVKEDIRGKGIATIFFETQHEIAKKQHKKYCELDVSMYNVRAKKLYERLGYKVLKELDYKGKANITGNIRMRLVL